MSIAPIPDSLTNSRTDNENSTGPVAETSELPGRFVRMYGDVYQCIDDSQELAPFFLTLVSSSNHWMFLSSNGGVSAGRRNAELAMFPYYASDQIIDQAHCTGAKTVFQIHWETSAGPRSEFWTPFSATATTGPQKVYLNESISSVVFEERNNAAGLVFRYRWEVSEKYGFIRSCELINESLEERSVRMVDGLQNLLPPGLPAAFQRRFSNLGDAYKRAELISVGSDSVPQLGIFYLNSIPTDNVEPSEGLLATTVFHLGLPTNATLLSSRQLDAVAKQQPVKNESETRGLRQAYLVESNFRLTPGATQEWKMVADIGSDQSKIVALKSELESSVCLASELESSIIEQREQLNQIIANGDGFQQGADRLSSARHRSNTTFNLMRGGVPGNGYRYPTDDFIEHLRQVAPSLLGTYSDALNALGTDPLLADLHRFANESDDVEFRRIALEYLPLTFSRRHGDPTRPWNEFNIPSRSLGGAPKLQYEGNWRDIFQNWEALGISYPNLLPSMILRFVNASTADGYNPYRLTKTGFDWEKPDPADPWANIGYWGDHQIIYLLRLLELAQKSNPASIQKALRDRLCVFANVPYRIAKYKDILAQPDNTIEFDQELSEQLVRDTSAAGESAKLLQLNDKALHCSLIEKLLITSLTKLGNLVPDAGIWLNTQRPEWNDANNALVGNGTSVVTVFYLARFFQQLATWLDGETYLVSQPIVDFLKQVNSCLAEHTFTDLTPGQRKEIVDRLQSASETYRETVYRETERGAFQDLVEMDSKTLSSFCDRAVEVLRCSLENNLREDSLYHSYNLIELQDQGISIEHLDVMLEGQVAALASGLLDIDASLRLLENLKASPLYRADVHSYLLYPDKDLPAFLEKNIVPQQREDRFKVVDSLLESKDEQIFKQDLTGNVRFCGDFRNVSDLNTAIKNFSSESDELKKLVAENADTLRELYESTFEHRKFTGRSGTFFAYEGLGSIYWHMVSKLILATFETWQTAHRNGHPRGNEVLGFYRDLKSGLGVHRSPREYGAFPTVPYSHTPKHAGAQQPGMTGQVKEDIISRFAELGIVVNEGQVRIQTETFDRQEMSESFFDFSYFDVDGQPQSISSDSGFAYTLCQTPVVYVFADESSLKVLFADGTERRSSELELTSAETQSLFSRDGKISRIEITFTR